jgi:hypothetical protein
MKKLILFLFISMSMSAAMGQDVEKDAISEAIKSSDPQKIAVYFMPSVDLTVESAEGVYSKDQAEMIIRRFFEDHVPKDFALKHQGKSKLDDYYYIGTLTTEKGEYRLTFFLKKTEDTFRIKQMRIENTP